MKPRYKTGDRVSYKGKAFRVVRAVMERGVLYDLGDEETGREAGLRVAEKELVLVGKRKEREVRRDS